MSTTGQTDATERIVNLAMYLSAARAPVTWEDIRGDVAGYPSDQTRDTFLRMFERDKKELREAGLVIESDAEGRYVLDESATYAAEVELDAEESAAVRAATAAFVNDPGFPFADDLRMAMAKLGSDTAPVPDVSARIADEAPENQGHDAAELADAAQRCKRVTFDYTTSAGATESRHVEPFGTFLREGRWYLVGRDLDRDAIRTFTLSRMRDLEVNAAKHATPDFERPEAFDITSYVLLPFQFGPEDFRATLHFDSDIAWRATSLTANRGKLTPLEDGSLRWDVRARSRHGLARWMIENGPGIEIVEPADLASEMHDLLEGVRLAHE